MIRRTLLMATAIIASVVITACSDVTAPKEGCVLQLPTKRVFLCGEGLNRIPQSRR